MVLWSVCDTFDHFQHRNREFLVGKLPSDLPALPVIEDDRRRIRLENEKPKCFTTATDEFSFALCQQSVGQRHIRDVGEPPIDSLTHSPCVSTIPTISVSTTATQERPQFSVYKFS